MVQRIHRFTVWIGDESASARTAKLERIRATPCGTYVRDKRPNNMNITVLCFDSSASVLCTGFNVNVLTTVECLPVEAIKPAFIFPSNWTYRFIVLRFSCFYYLLATMMIAFFRILRRKWTKKINIVLILSRTVFGDDAMQNNMVLCRGYDDRFE